MNRGAIIFLSGFAVLAASWLGFVLAPQLQLGRQELVRLASTSALYPSRRPGMAEQGAQVYRANGCNACHSQQVRQGGTVFDVTINKVGTNLTAPLAALKSINPDFDKEALGRLPVDVLHGVDKATATAADEVLKTAGVDYEVRIRPTGVDMDRGWGRRGSVAQDYLQDSPVFLGTQRLGPDLANIGARKPDINWHLNHLYSPASVVPGSTMPPYRFLFEKCKMGRLPSPNALKLAGAAAPESGYEIIPSQQALALAAYLMSLHADEPLPEAPMSALGAGPVTSATPVK
jgi:cbb3-type cytochrome oxidase cytochrome c subunit